MRWSSPMEVLLTCLYEGQEATVLQLPVETHTAAEAKKREPARFDHCLNRRRWRLSPCFCTRGHGIPVGDADFEHVLVNSAAVAGGIQ